MTTIWIGQDSPKALWSTEDPQLAELYYEQMVGIYPESDGELWISEPEVVS